MRLKPVELALVMALVVTIFAGGIVNAEASGLSDKLIRLHVVAASDSDADQALKLKVRDRVLSLIEEPLSRAGTREEAEETVRGLTERIAAVSREEIGKNGCTYPVRVSLEREYFPTTDYDDFSLPAGEYLSLRVVIGEGEGHNWWCVVFPRVCFGGILNASEDTALTEGDVELVTRSTGTAKVKFRAIELFSGLKRFICGL